MRECCTTERVPAFTLVELVIVVFVIGLSTAIVVPKFMDGADKASQVQTNANRILLQNAVDAYLQDHGEIPEAWYRGNGEPNSKTVAERLLGTTIKAGNLSSGTDKVLFGPYLDKLPANPNTGDRNHIGILVYYDPPGDLCVPSGGPLANGQEWYSDQCGWLLHADVYNPTYEVFDITQF